MKCLIRNNNKRMSRIYWCLSLVLICFVLQAQAQTTYPVQVNANLLPPFTPYLSDYYSGTREKLTVTLINRDQFKPTLSVRLRMIITAPGGIRIQTNDRAFIEPINLENGSPIRLTQDDLAPYFQPQNIITQGVLTSGRLPEGMIEFCFQVIEAYTGQVLSLSSCTRAWIVNQKPPLLSLPRNNESMLFRDPLNVLFQWTPLHQGLTGVEYDFILKELWDNGMTAQAAFPYAPEIYRETTRSTSIIYGALNPPLLAGKRYAWCVQAKVREGLDELNVFQNNGYSEIRTFTLQDNCSPIDFVKGTAERKRLNVEWTPRPEHIGFSVSYRLVKSRSLDGKVDASEWKEQQTLESNMALYGLQDGSTYEYRVGSYCMVGQPVYSPILSITLPNTDSARLAQCGIMPNINLTNKEPIKELKTSEVIMANDYPVTITRISGGNGDFSGEGWIVVPWLNDAKIAVQFTNIVVNTDKQMIGGYIDAKYDKTEGQIANLDDVFEGGFDVGSVKTGITKIDYTFDYSIPGVEAFSLNDEGDLVIKDSDNVPHVVTASDKEGTGNEGNKVVVFPMTVKDKDGNVYQVEKVTETDAVTGKTKEVAKATYIGKAGTPLASGSFDPDQLNGDKAIVTFAKGDGKYAFDTWMDYYDNVSLIKSKYQKLYTGYYAPWKLVPVGATDKVTATIAIKDKNIVAEQVIFKTTKGTEYKAAYSNGTYTLQLAAGETGDVQELYALYPNGKDKYFTLGKLNVASYQPQTYKVVLVPVNNVPVDKDKIKQTLTDIYGPMAITWQVELDANFDYTDNYNLMKDATGLSTYNDDMRSLNNAYKTARATKFDRAANYLFFLKATGAEEINNRDATGFMPRGAQFGYLFTSEIKDVNEPITVAHELGHGRWKLYHTFDEHYGGYKRGETENVMDYKNGKHLAKWQWDIINDPAMLVSVFEGDDKSQYKSWEFLEGDLVANIPGYENSSKSFLSLAGEIITLPANARDFTFYNGYLAKFTIGEERYISLKKDDVFDGYYFDAIQIKSSSYDTKKSKPYIGKLDDISKKAVIFFIKKNSSSTCGAYDIRKAEYQKVLSVNNDGGIGKSITFYKNNDIESVKTILGESAFVLTVSEKINCLQARGKELYKFILDHYELNGHPISSSQGDELVKQLSFFNTVHVKDLDGDYAGGQDQVRSLKIREMLRYGVIEFLAKLSTIITDLNQENASATRALLVEFEDYNRLKDIYLLYNITVKFDPDCTVAEHLREEINKQVKEKGEVAFNLDFFTAVAKSGFELVSGNELLEAVNCILKNIKAPESLYNPNRMDYKLKEFYESLFKNMLGLDSHSLVVQIPLRAQQYEFACGCGVWNSVVDLVLGLSELGSGLTQNPIDLFKKTGEFYESATKEGGLGEMGDGVWDIIKEHHGYVEGYGVDSYQATYGVCYDVVMVASFFVGVGELKALSEAGKLGNISEMARIIARAGKAYPKNVALSFKQLGQAVATISTNTARKVIFKIIETAPTKLLAKLPSNVKGVIIATAVNDIVRFTELGVIEIITPLGSVADRTKNIIYQSSESLTDINGKTGKLVLIEEEGGKVSGYLELAKEADVPTSLVAKLTQQGSGELKSWLNSKTLSYADNAGAKFSGTTAEIKIFSDLDAAIGNKRVLETIEDAQGRLSVVLERPGQTNQVVSIHPTSAGDFKMTTFEPAYNPSLNPDIPVPVSRNRLVPDYSTTTYLHPQTKGKTIRIEMKGNRNSDFKAANEAGGFGSTYSTPTFTKPDGTVVQYTWHHLDDFEIVNGKAYCTMQLVETIVHGGTGVTGMAHSGSVAQWRGFFGSGY
jgi:hypothetical protein